MIARQWAVKQEEEGHSFAVRMKNRPQIQMNHRKAQQHKNVDVKGLNLTIVSPRKTVMTAREKVTKFD